MPAAGFDPKLWLSALTNTGAGYALTSNRHLVLLMDGCPKDALGPIVEEIIGHPDRQEAVKVAIEQRQLGAA